MLPPVRTKLVWAARVCSNSYWSGSGAATHLTKWDGRKSRSGKWCSSFHISLLPSLVDQPALNTDQQSQRTPWDRLALDKSRSGFRWFGKDACPLPLRKRKRGPEQVAWLSRSQFSRIWSTRQVIAGLLAQFWGFWKPFCFRNPRCVHCKMLAECCIGAEVDVSWLHVHALVCLWHLEPIASNGCRNSCEDKGGAG